MVVSFGFGIEVFEKRGRLGRDKPGHDGEDVAAWP